MTHTYSSPPSGTTQVHISSLADLFAAIPYALGFHPAPGDVVVAGLANGKVCGVARDAISTPADVLAAALLTHFHHLPDVDGVLIAGYARPQDEAHLAELALLVHAAGYRLVQVLRADHQRVFCLTCDCCGQDGVPYDPAASTIPAQAVVAGKVALPSRQVMLDQLAHDPAASARLESALDVVCGQLLTDRPNDDQATGFIEETLRRAQAGQRLDDQSAARLIILISVDRDWRDHAWCATGNQAWLAALWQDLTRRCPRNALLVAVPAMAAWSAWRCGNTMLAHTAADIAAELDPSYRLTELLRTVLDAGLPPSMMPWPPTGADGDPLAAAQTAVP